MIQKPQHDFHLSATSGQLYHEGNTNPFTRSEVWAVTGQESNVVVQNGLPQPLVFTGR